MGILGVPTSKILLRDVEVSQTQGYPFESPIIWFVVFCDLYRDPPVLGNTMYKNFQNPKSRGYGHLHLAEGKGTGPSEEGPESQLEEP